MSERDDELGNRRRISATDTDWIELNKLRNTLENGGSERAFQKSFKSLAERNPGCAFRIYEAFFLHNALNALKDGMAEAGLDLEDLKEMIAEAEPKATKQ
jgi:hypothetical protein